MAKAAVIFDVDGVLLKLTPEEEVLFFAPFAKRCDAAKLSRDWNSYRIRNDEDIIAELVEGQNLPVSECELIRQEYLSLLRQKLLDKTVTSQKITGVQELLDQLSGATLGIATANFREAAKLRLEQAELWHHIAAHAFGADGGGHKHEILKRALASFKLPLSQIVYIGDNVNDVEAGILNGVHFIGFSENQHRLATLQAAGASNLSSNHSQTLALIRTLITL